MSKISIDDVKNRKFNLTTNEEEPKLNDQVSYDESYMNSFFKDGYQRFDNQVKITNNVKIETHPSIEDLEGWKKLYEGLNKNKEYLKNNFGVDFFGVDLSDPISSLNFFIKNKPNNNAWIQTFTGKKFFPLDPQIEDICIEDIAHALSMICRFTGHVKEFYSVAQHCVLVSYFCNSEDRKHGLLHDGSEAYLMDIAAPIKRSEEFSKYREIEKHLQCMIYKSFNLSVEEPASVKQADLLMLSTEAKNLLPVIDESFRFSIKAIEGLKIVPLPPKEAEELFLDRFKELFLIAE